MANVTLRRCFLCERATLTYCEVSGLPFCSPEHRLAHWDANPSLYALQGKKDAKEKARRQKEKERKKKRTARSGDKTSLVAASIGQMPRGTMSERDALHLHELKTRFDNARDGHRKALRQEAQRPSDDPEVMQSREQAATARLADMRVRRQAVLDEYKRLAQQLTEAQDDARERERQARLGYEYVLQEHVRFEDRSGDEQFEAWQPKPRPITTTTTVTVRPNDNSNAQQVVIEVEEEDNEKHNDRLIDDHHCECDAES